VMLSESTARLVEGAATLGEPEMLHVNRRTRRADRRTPRSGGRPAFRLCLAHARRCLVQQPRYTRRTDQLGTRPPRGGRATGQRSGTHDHAHSPENGAVYDHLACRAWRRRHRFRRAS
jgi:hypothetical protein